jgi:hypothetical protein
MRKGLQAPSCIRRGEGACSSRRSGFVTPTLTFAKMTSSHQYQTNKKRAQTDKSEYPVRPFFGKGWWFDL